MECCNQNKHWESSNSALPHFIGKEMETWGIQYLPKITWLVISRLSSPLFFPPQHSASDLQAEQTRDDISEVTHMTKCTQDIERSPSETKSPQGIYQPLTMFKQNPKMWGHFRPLSLNLDFTLLKKKAFTLPTSLSLVHCSLQVLAVH